MEISKKKEGLYSFRIYFNKLNNFAFCKIFDGNKTIEAIPKDIWDDFCATTPTTKIEDTLLYKAIAPNVGANSRKNWDFNFLIVGVGLAPHYISRVQEVPFHNCMPTQQEILFRDWFLHLCKEKMHNTKKVVRSKSQSFY